MARKTAPETDEGDRQADEAAARRLARVSKAYTEAEAASAAADGTGGDHYAYLFLAMLEAANAPDEETE